MTPRSIGLWSAIVCAALIGEPLDAAQRIEVVGKFEKLPVTAGYAAPTFHSGYMVQFGITFPPEIKVFANSGATATDARIAFDTAPYVRIRGATVSRTGRVAFSAVARDKEGRLAETIGWMNPSGDLEFVVRTDDYAAKHLTFAPDGTLWILGYNNRIDVMAHFSAAGEQIMPFIELPRISRVRNFVTAGAILTNASRVALVLDTRRLIVEFAHDGATLGKWPLPPNKEVRGTALTDSGDLYLAMSNPRPRVPTELDEYQADHQLLRLDRLRGIWEEIEFSHLIKPDEPEFIHLYGADDDNLVIGTPDPEEEYLIVRTTQQ